MANPFGDEEHGSNPFGDAEATGNPFGDKEEAPQTTLFSTEGVKAIGKSIAPTVERGLLGLNLFRQENPDPIMDKPLVKMPGRGIPVEEGNVNLNNRPSVKNPDGSVSTIRSLGFHDGKHEVLVPTVSDDGRIMSDDEAVQQYYTTGKHLGKFNTPEESTAYAKELSQKQSELVATRKALQANQAEIDQVTPANPSYPLKIATGAVQSIAQNAPALAAAVATKNPAPMIASAAAQTKGQSYAADRMENPFGDAPVSQENAVKNAGIKAGLEGALEIIPAAGLLKDVGKQSLGKTAGKFILREEATEIPTTIGQNISDQVYAHPDKPIGQFARDTLSDVIDTAVTTPFAAGGTVALASAQQKLQDKLATVFQRKEADQQQTLDAYKQDLTAQLQQKLQEDATGIPEDELMAQKMVTQVNHQDVPDRPLTPEEEVLAKVQLDNMKSGADAIPPNPVAQADTADFDRILSDPIYQQPEDVAAKKEAMIQNDMDRGMSREVAERRALDEFPVTLPPTQRPIAWSTNAGQIGLNLQQAAIAPGDVVVIGGNDEQFSPAYTQALGQTVAEWSRIIMPEGSRIVLNLSGLTGNAVGGYQQSASGIHIISPRELVRTARGENQTNEGVTLGTESGNTGYNTFTQQQTFGALTHEFGHALTMASFAARMPRGYKNIVGALDTGRTYSEQEIAQMPQEEGAVVREYQAMKQRVLDGSMSAEELVENWLGPWKVGKDLMKVQSKSLYSFAHAALLREAKLTGDSRLSSTPLNLIPARTLIHAMGRNTNVAPEQSDAAAENYYLQFNEYMAEQFSRYAHEKKIDQGTPLGVYFKRALDSLRAFFKSLKTRNNISGEAIIKAGTSFTEWIDAMGNAKALRMAEAARPKTSRKPVVRKPKKTPDVEDLPRELAKKEEEKEKAAGEGMAVDETEQLAEDRLTKDLLRDRIRQMLPDPNDRNRAELMQMVARGQLVEAEDQLIDIVNEQVKKDVREAGGHWDPTFMADFIAPLKLWGDTGTWAKKALFRYMAKSFGTANDPLKDLVIPRGHEFVTWESQTVPYIKSGAWTELHVKAAKRFNPAAAAFAENIRVGDTIHDLVTTHDANNALFAIGDYVNHVIDYMEQHVDPAKYQQYDFVRAAKETAKQDERQRKKMETTEGQLEGTVPVQSYPDGFQWVRVESPEALKNEGDAMGHCVGGYCEMVQRGETLIYSLRDPMGRPHVTIEVQPEQGTQVDESTIGEFDQVPYYQGPTILQIKGKQNLAPNEQYWPHAQDFIMKHEWDNVFEAGNVGLADIKDFFAIGIKDTDFQYDWHEYNSLLADLGNYLDLVMPNSSNYYPINTAMPLVKQWMQEQTAKDNATGPMLDKDIEEVEAALKRVGAKDIPLWTRAVSFARRAQHAILQLQQLSHGNDDVGLETFVLNQTKLMAMKNNMLKTGTEVAQRWEKLSRGDAERVEKVLTDEFHSGGHASTLAQDPNTGKWQHTAGIGFIDYLKQRGIDATTPEGEALGKLILDIKNSILEHIQIVEDMAIQQVKYRYRKAPLIVQKRSFEIREAARKWRTVPFVPQGHYGNYVVKVFEKDEDGKRQLAYQGHFETAAEQDAAVQKFLKVKPLEDVKWFKIADKTGVQLSLPTDFLETLEDTGEFSSDQLQAIGDAMTPLRSDKGFSKFARDASKVKGANPDVLRNYANWIEDNANFVSKLTYGRMMTASRAWTRSDMAELKAQGDIAGARKKQELLDTMTKAQDFILHPQEEWFQTRSVIALTFLMYAPKTALMNATGLFQTWAAMTADYGDITGNKIMAKATKDLISGKLTADEQWMKNKALEDGIIDQGFGYFMSGLANAGNLARRIRPTLIGRGARLFVDLGMWPFKAVETANRNLTMLAIYRAERTREMGRGNDLETAKANAYNTASRKTRLLQNDYASGNRPEVLRGRKSLFMIFLSYPQYMLWIMSGGYERGTRAESRARGETPRSALGGMTARMWLIFLALAGTEGVPFGESILELLQRMWTLFGKGDNIRVEGQRFLKETAGIESMYWRNVIQRGFLHDVLGVDLSGSYSLGKPLPGLGLINPQSDNWREFVGEAFEELAGPFGGFVKGGVGLGLSEDVGTKELGKNLPGAAGSIARAIGAAKEGVKSNKGERILRDESGNLREPTKAEIAAIGAGFRLSQVANFQRLEMLKKQQADYWNGRRIGLKHSYKRAVEDQDPQVREDVLKAVEEYNEEIPAQGLRLSFKELREYVRQDARKVRRLEQDRDPARVRGLNRDISEVMSAP